MASITICSDFGAQENKVFTVSIVSPSICHEVMGSEAMILVFWMLSFKPTFSLSSFTFIKRLFSCSWLSAIRVVSSAYLKLIFLPAILFPVCAFYNPAFLMMYSAYRLNISLVGEYFICESVHLWGQTILTKHKHFKELPYVCRSLQNHWLKNKNIVTSVRENCIF